MLWIAVTLLSLGAIIGTTIIAWTVNGIATVARDEITEPIDDLDP